MREPGVGGWGSLTTPSVVTGHYWDRFSSVSNLPLAFDASGTLVAGGLAWGYGTLDDGDLGGDRGPPRPWISFLDG